MNEGDLTDEQIRDWYAGQALFGLLACPNVHATNEKIAKSAFDLAEWMMKERQLRDGGKD